MEKQRENQRRKVSDHVEAGRERGREVPMVQAAPPRDRYTDSEWREREEDKSLEGLLTLARREMEQEKQLKKVSTKTELFHCSYMNILSDMVMD